MVSKMVITCTGCGKKIEGPVTLEGKKIRCKVCSTVFTVPASGSKKSAGQTKSSKAEPVLDVMPAEVEEEKEVLTVATAESDEEDGPARTPYSVSDVKLSPRCPQCANDMDEGDIICLHCGYNLQTREISHTVKTIETTGLDWTLWLTPGILCVIADFMLLGGIVVFWTVFPWLDKKFDAEWWNHLLFGFWVQLWGTVLFLFLMFFAGRFAIRRLILHPRPPEKFKH